MRISNRGSGSTGQADFVRDLSYELRSRLICEGALPFTSWVTSRAQMRDFFDEDWSQSGGSTLGKRCPQ